MHDMVDVTTADECLFGVASTQLGYFTASQAVGCEFSRSLLAYHARSGRFRRERRGLYRLRDYPSSMHEEIMVGWLAVGRDVAIVSHQSALELLDLSDVTANAIHLTVPRAYRERATVPGVRVHTTSKPFEPLDVVTREGMRVTSPIRTVLDIDEVGVSLEHVEIAAREAIRRGQATPRMFYERAMRYGGRFRSHLAHGLVVL